MKTSDSTLPLHDTKTQKATERCDQLTLFHIMFESGGAISPRCNMDKSVEGSPSIRHSY